MGSFYGLGSGGVEVAFTVTAKVGEHLVFLSRTLAKHFAQIPAIAVKWCLEP